MSFTWLHFTDRHTGMSEGHKWSRRRTELLDDLARLHRKVGRVDAVLFTGDLTQKGTEFEQFTEEFRPVLDGLRALGSDPVFLAVPGNHDLVRPAPHTSFVDGLRDGNHESLWANGENDYRTGVQEAFRAWSGWSAEALSWGDPRICDVRREGLLPGDFLATWARDDLRIGIAGLNSAAVQLGGGDYRGRLALDSRQLTRLQPEIDAWCRQHDACLLLTHHPRDWLTASSQADFDSDVSSPTASSRTSVGTTTSNRPTGPRRASAQCVGRSSVGRCSAWRRLTGASSGCMGTASARCGWTGGGAGFGSGRAWRRRRATDPTPSDRIRSPMSVGTARRSCSTSDCRGGSGP